MGNRRETRKAPEGDDAFGAAFDESEDRMDEAEKIEEQSLTKKAQRAFEAASNVMSEEVRGVLHYSNQLKRIAKDLETHIIDAQQGALHFLASSKKNRLGGRQYSHSIPIKGPVAFTLNPLSTRKTPDFFELAAKMRGITVEKIQATTGFRQVLAAVERYNRTPHVITNTRTNTKENIRLLAEIDGAHTYRRSQLDFSLELHFKAEPIEEREG